MSTDVLVIDLGSGLIKAGWAGEDQPRTTQPAAVARVRNQSSAVTPVNDDLLTGLDAIRSVADHGQALELTSPFDRGQIVDWNAIQHTLATIYAHDLGGIDTDAYPVLIAESPFASLKQREKLADLLFRHFRAPAILIYNSAVLSLFSSGSTTGLVVESSESATYSVPVFEGYPLRHGIEMMPIGGADLTKHMTSLLHKPDLRLDVARDLKDQYAIVAPGPDHRPALDPVEYELPDGSMITIADEVRYSTGEMLFDHGLPDLALRSVAKCDTNLQSAVLNRIVTAGGSTLMRGFHDRITAEFTSKAHDLYPGTEVRVFGKRKHAAWMGGSMLASLSTFSDLKITRQEFEDGDEIVHKKYF